MKLKVDSLNFCFNNNRSNNSVNLDYLIEDKFIIEIYKNTITIFRR